MSGFASLLPTSTVLELRTFLDRHPRGAIQTLRGRFGRVRSARHGGVDGGGAERRPAAVDSSGASPLLKARVNMVLSALWAQFGLPQARSMSSLRQHHQPLHRLLGNSRPNASSTARHEKRPEAEPVRLVHVVDLGVSCGSASTRSQGDRRLQGHAAHEAR